jgi:hypothetical protein
MQIDFSDGRGKVVRLTPKGTYMVKLLFKSSGFYANNVRVVPSKDNPGEWRVYPPAHPVSKGWKGDCEFDQSKSLWKVIEELAVKVVEASLEQKGAREDDFTDFDAGIAESIDHFQRGDQPP